MSFRILLAVDGKVIKCLYGQMCLQNLSIKMIEVFSTDLCQRWGSGTMGWPESNSCIPLHCCSPGALGGNYSGKKYTTTWNNSYWSLSVLKNHFIHHGNVPGWKILHSSIGGRKTFFAGAFEEILLLGIAVVSKISAVERSATRILMFSFIDICVVSCMNLPIYLLWKEEGLSQFLLEFKVKLSDVLVIKSFAEISKPALAV